MLRDATGDDAAQTAIPSALTTDPTGWRDIMPPADLKGWFRVPIPFKNTLGRAQWHVDNGTLVCDGDGGHDMLLLDQKFKNCIFHVEFCFTKIEGMKGYNSGVFIRTSRDGASGIRRRWGVSAAATGSARRRTLRNCATFMPKPSPAA